MSITAGHSPKSGRVFCESLDLRPPVALDVVPCVASKHEHGVWPCTCSAVSCELEEMLRAAHHRLDAGRTRRQPTRALDWSAWRQLPGRVSCLDGRRL